MSGIPPFGSAPTPDATDSKKGKLQLTNDLGGTADAPTTPTAIHVTGDEYMDGKKEFGGKTVRHGGLAVTGTYLNSFSSYGTTAAIFNDVSARSTYIYQNDDLPSATTPFYVKNEDTGELIKVVSDSGYTWSACERGLFGTTPSPVTVGDVFTLQPTGDNATYMTPDYERVLVDCTGGLMEVILPNPVDYPTMEDGLTFSICDFVGSLGNGNALIVKDPTNGNSIEVWDPGAIVTAVYDLSSGLYTFLSTKSLASDYASPAKYAVRVATTAALAVTSYSFPSLVLSSSLTAIEGVTLKAGDLILVKDQAVASQNGVYIYNTSTNLIRDPNFQTGQNFVPALQFYVAEGIINADSVFILTANDNIVLDTTSLTFRRSGGVQPVSSKTANYTVTAADDGVIISYTTLAAARTVTLPALSAVSEGFMVTVADGTSGTHASTNNITIQRAGSDVFVDGSTSKTLNVAGGAMTFIKLNGLWTVSEDWGTTIKSKLQIGTAAGSTTVPDFYGYDTDTGISFTNNNVISFIAASVARITLSNSQITTTLPIRGQDGTAAAPAYTFSGDNDTGIYRVGADQIGIAIAGALAIKLTATGLEIGGDTNLYRESANVLATDDKLHVVGELEVDGDLNHDGTNIGFFGVAPVARATELTDELTTVTHTAPGTPDYAISAPVDSSGGAAFGFASADEFNTVMAVIANLQTRNKELEDKLTAYGLLQDAD